MAVTLNTSLIVIQARSFDYTASCSAQDDELRSNIVPSPSGEGYNKENNSDRLTVGGVGNTHRHVE
jgi:hypothetical protein